MTRFSQLVSGLMLAASVVSAIPHDEVTPFGESAPSLFLKYKPYLKVQHGCVPFPAVDKEGHLNNGLETGGASNGLCSESEGQVYSRGNKFPNSYAIMYAWYMPKDQPVNGVGGHTHDWESIVVWLSSDSKDAKYLGLAYSGHGGYTAVPLGEDEDDNFDGNKPLIKYLTNGITNHELSLGTEKGGEQPLIDWESLPGAARQALDQADFGSANVPFKWANFHNNLAKASLN